MNIYKPSHVQYKTNEEGIQNVRHRFLGEIIVSTTDFLPAISSGMERIKTGRSWKRMSWPNNHNKEQDLDTNTADNEDDKYSVTYTLKCDGHHDVVIEVNGQLLTRSPA